MTDDLIANHPRHRRTKEPTMKKAKPIRQGDVLLYPVASLPAGAQPLPLDNGRVVLAYGEATGHAHAIAVSAAAAQEITEALIARLYEHHGDRYLVVHAPVALTHEEHTAITLPPGIYEVPVQMEYDAATMRRVQD